MQVDGKTRARFGANLFIYIPKTHEGIKNSQVTNCQRETVLSLYFGPDPDSLYLLSVCLRELSFSVACWVDPACCLSMSVGSSLFFFL
jgi:hypothetical protein